MHHTNSDDWIAQFRLHDMHKIREYTMKSGRSIHQALALIEYNYIVFIMNLLYVFVNVFSCFCFFHLRTGVLSQISGRNPIGGGGGVWMDDAARTFELICMKNFLVWSHISDRNPIVFLPSRWGWGSYLRWFIRDLYNIIV